MSDPHCSKCCPVEPETPAAPEPLPPAAVAAVLLMALVVVGGWLVVIWMGTSLFGG
ncbi:hypothetical protein [Streptomyces sp. NPDC000410]|uniref:hypothetical protein n=1 Tax=Streptomyces sp. NPDC000410 TaxID=3154254 RepID=UPI003325FA08